MARSTNRQKLTNYLAARQWASIGKTEWEQLRGDVPEIAENSLREILQESGLEIEQPYCGVQQKSLAALERSLLDLKRVYSEQPDRAAICRKLVIQAKDRARFAARNRNVAEATRAMKEEMVRWMLVWLDDPSMFETWVRIRNRQREPR